jgi:hypothetical protein
VLTNELVLQMGNYRKESGNDRMIVEKLIYSISGEKE